ncbi:AH receptor-interacting protein [Paragonimus westermani]|uniref:AH receptor-interacting protein n=1 Tax=Paragonimus westermani TaxID=34504 RepID=A0A5J4NJY3_9TREM|nr:AH receptor-interacting protein [Paragonimus westermani]
MLTVDCAVRLVGSAKACSRRKTFRNLFIVSASAPPDCSDAGVKDAFYSDLAALLRSTRGSDIVVLAGDMNAQVGRLGEAESRLGDRFRIASNHSDNGAFDSVDRSTLLGRLDAGVYRPNEIVKDCLRCSQDADVDIRPEEGLVDLDYADDKVLLFDNFQAAQTTLNAISSSAKYFGMCFAAYKCEVLLQWKQADTGDPVSKVHSSDIGAKNIEKRTLHAGTGSIPPGCEAPGGGLAYPKESKFIFHYQIRKVDSDQTVLDDTRKYGKTMEIYSGKEFQMDFWEHCLGTMLPGEVASFTVPPERLLAFPAVNKKLRDYMLNKTGGAAKHCCGLMGFQEQGGLGYPDLDELMVKPETLEFIFQLIRYDPFDPTFFHEPSRPPLLNPSTRFEFRSQGSSSIGHTFATAGG